MDRQKHIKDYYDQFYAHAPTERIEADTKRINNNLENMEIKRGSRILDVGCGTGGILNYLSQKGAIPLGIDISIQALRSAKHLGSNFKLTLCNAEELPFQSNCMEGVIFMGTLEHFLDPVRALEEAIRVTGPGSSFCIVVPNSEFFLIRWFGGTEQDQEEAFTLQEWSDLFKKTGLSICSITRDTGPGIRTGPFIKGIVRKAVLIISSFLPLRYTYQFVFICRE